MSFVASTHHSGAHAEEAHVSIAVFDFELEDTSLSGAKLGEKTDEKARLKLISDLLRNHLSETGKYEIRDLEPIADALTNAGPIMHCNGCEVDLAKKLGAQISIHGHVHKVSNLILSVNMYVNDVSEAKRIAVFSADIRGNTDQSWSHGMKWLMRNRLFETLEKVPE